eukprot:TRINITY_DN3947_c0_g1_i2.p1 TRINITY_DN3947_c0_g1~~TRINITY_DN3947_c0_g1_i2.p1  ORF type:complete len:504 (-),score=40.08 TRINITY_DN3947_c0_g1_i2:214-1623(-)
MAQTRRLLVLLLAGVIGCTAQPSVRLITLPCRVAIFSFPAVAGISLHSVQPYDRADAGRLYSFTFADDSLQDLVAADSSLGPQSRNMTAGTVEEPRGGAALVAFESINAAVVAGLVGVLVWMLWTLSEKIDGTAATVASWLFSIAPFILTFTAFLSISRFFFQHDARHVPLHPVAPAACIYVLKLLISLVMYRCANGTFVDLAKDLTRDVKIWLMYTIPVALNVTYTVLSFFALRQMNAAQYVILLHVRTVIAAFLWEIVMSKRLSGMQWGLLITCIYAVVLTERATLQAILASGAIMDLAVYATICAQWFCSVLCNLAKEKILKTQELSVNAQNVVQDVLGSSLLAAFLLAAYVLKPSEPLLTMADIPHLMVPSMALSILTLALLGVSCSFLLKYLGVIWKEITGMLVTVTTASIDWFVLRTKPAGVLDVEAVIILAVSVCILALFEKLEIDPVRTSLSQSLKSAFTK